MAILFRRVVAVIVGGHFDGGKRTKENKEERSAVFLSLRKVLDYRQDTGLG